MATRTDEEETGAQLEFEGAVEIEGTRDELWAFISDPENLVDCVPGAEEVQRRSDREYSFVVEQGIGRFTVTLDGEVELVEMDEPDFVVADGSAYDGGTGSTFEGLAAMEMSGDDPVDLAYTAEMTFTGGVASLGARLVRRVIRSNVDEYFDNIRAEFEGEEA
jgi:carbon monoxide dehydrogenase subunit G